MLVTTSPRPTHVLLRNPPRLPASPAPFPTPPVPSSHQHRHATGEKHPKEPGGKGKKNRNLKIGEITVSEKWRESVFHKITNANELKYLDEFLLNKVGSRGPGPGTLGAGVPRRVAPDLPGGPLPLGSFLNRHTKALTMWEQKGQVHGSNTQKVLEITCFCLCLASAGFLQNPARIPVRSLVACSHPVLCPY